MTRLESVDYFDILPSRLDRAPPPLPSKYKVWNQTLRRKMRWWLAVLGKSRPWSSGESTGQPGQTIDDTWRIAVRRSVDGWWNSLGRKASRPLETGWCHVAMFSLENKNCNFVFLDEEKNLRWEQTTFLVLLLMMTTTTTIMIMMM